MGLEDLSSFYLCAALYLFRILNEIFLHVLPEVLFNYFLSSTTFLHSYDDKGNFMLMQATGCHSWLIAPKSLLCITPYLQLCYAKALELCWIHYILLKLEKIIYETNKNLSYLRELILQSNIDGFGLQFIRYLMVRIRGGHW